MKRYLIPLLLLAVIASCNRGAKNVPLIDESQVNQQGIARLPQEGFELIGIPDVVHPMSAELFETLPDSLRQQTMPNGSAPASTNVFLVANEHHQLLFDTGVGAAKGGVLLSKLKALSVDAEDVDAIFLTHLHGDHIGGLVQNQEAVFPNAEIYISTTEYEAWVNGSLKEQNEAVMEMLSYYAPRLNLVNDGDTLLGFITVHVLQGHTPGHTLYELPNVLIAGDLLHAKDLQMDYPEYSCRYDSNPEQAAAERKYYLDYALTHNLVFADMHFPWPCVVDFTK